MQVGKITVSEILITRQEEWWREKLQKMKSLSKDKREKLRKMKSLSKDKEN